MSRFHSISLALLVLLLAACSAAPTPAPTRISTPTLLPTAAATATLTPSATPFITPTPTATVTATATLTPLPPLPAALETPVQAPAQAIDPAGVRLLRELARWGKGRAEQVEFSPDGQWLLVKTAQSSVVYPAQSLVGGRSFEGNLIFSPQGQTAITLSARVDLWQVSDWKWLAGFSGEQAAYAPDGGLLAVSDGESVQVRQAADGKLLRSLAHKKVEHLYFSRDGAQLVTLSRESLQAWQVADGKLLKTLDYERVLRAAAVRQGGLWLVQARTRQSEPVIEVYDAQDWALRATLPVSGSFTLQPDGTRLFVYSNFPTPGRVEIFSLPAGELVGEMRAGGSIYRLVASPDNQTLAASIVDFSPSNQQTVGYMKTFDSSGKELKRLDCGIFCDPQQPVFAPDGKLLAVEGVSSANGLYIGTTFLFDPRTGERARTLRGPKTVAGSIEKVAFAPDAKSLVTLTGRSDDAVRIWKVADGSLLGTLESGPEALNLGDLAPDGKQLAVYSDVGVTRLIHGQTGAAGVQFEKASEPRFSPRGEWLAVGDAAGVRLVRAATGETLTNFPKNLVGPMIFSPLEELGVFFKDFSAQLLKLPGGGFAGTLNATGKPNVRLTVGAFSPDGKLLAAGSQNGEVWLWQMAEKKQWQILEGHKFTVTVVQFSRDGKTLLTGSSDGGVRLWSSADGKLLKSFNTSDLIRRAPEFDEGTFGQLAALALSPDGALVAVSGYLNPLQPFPTRAGAVALISTADGALLRVLPGGGGALAYSADGKFLYSSGDGAVHVWGVLP